MLIGLLLVAMLLVDPLLVSKKEGARLLGVSVRTIDYLIARKVLTGRRLGRRVLLVFKELQLLARRDHYSVRDGACEGESVVEERP